MPPTYVLARDHLVRASSILRGSDNRSRQLRYIIDRTITLMEEARPEPASPPSGNVLDFHAFRQNRTALLD